MSSLTNEAFERLCLTSGRKYAETFQDFVEKQVNRMVTSFYKYGALNLESTQAINMMRTLQVRLDKYLETHNTEYLVDAANFCAIEFCFPSFGDAFFRAEGSEKSPGVIDYKGRTTHKHYKDIQ